MKSISKHDEYFNFGCLHEKFTRLQPSLPKQKQHAQNPKQSNLQGD
jgi:hypothetical protein